MTKSFHRDGDPDGLYAVAGKSPSGEYGVVLSFGQVVLMFIAEDGLSDFLAAAKKNPELDATITKLIADAAARLPEFKQASLKISAAERN